MTEYPDLLIINLLRYKTINEVLISDIVSKNNYPIFSIIRIGDYHYIGGTFSDELLIAKEDKIVS